jgi:hypothetical protein
MSISKSIAIILGLLLAALYLACADRKNSKAHRIDTSSKSDSAVVRVWPVPANASRTTYGLRYVVLRQGRARKRPAAYAVAYRYTSYDMRGGIVGSSNDIIQSPTATKEWADIFETMMPGEIRRVWVETDGTVKVYDVELHGFIVLENGKERQNTP